MRAVGEAAMRILVTGAAGFLGSHLVDALLDQGHDVTALDNFSTGQWRHDPERVHVIRHDVREPMHFAYVDRIYHLACPASPLWYQKDPAFTLETGTVGAWNVLELARKVGARFLLASTSEVYGDPTSHPQREDYWGNVNSCGSRSCYDEAKRVGEAMCWTFASQYETDVRIARIFNTYGPRMPEGDGRVVSNFVCQALRGDPITVYGDGTQTRSLCYVSDTVRGLMALMESDEVRPVNIGNPDEVTLNELARDVRALCDSMSPLLRCPLPKDDPTRRCPDITRAKEVLGWSPSVSRTEGLRETIEWFHLRLSGDARKARDHCAALDIGKTSVA